MRVKLLNVASSVLESELLPYETSSPRVDHDTRAKIIAALEV